MTSRADTIWRWTLRVVGLLAFITLLVIFASGREVPAHWIFVVGAMLGLERAWEIFGPSGGSDPAPKRKRSTAQRKRRR